MPLSYTIVTENEKIVLKHGPSTYKSACSLEIFLTFQNSEDHFEKYMACTEEDQLLGGDFHALLDRIEDDMLQIVKN